MIFFEYVEVKNFMNYGNAVTRLSLDSHRNTIITGKNGAGKSSILLDTLCYVLYDKPYRSIKKSQLINSINAKNCLVTIGFKKGSDEYVVSRGQKPSVFDIKKNGTLIDEKALAGSHQEYLEDVIGMNFATFKQIVVIGSANYIPFMRLDTPSRRKIVESMLPVTIYSEAGKISRERISETKAAITIIDSKITTTKNALAKTKELLIAMQKDQASVDLEIESKRSAIETRVESISKERAILVESLEKYNIQSLKDTLSKLNDGKSRLRSMITTATALIDDAVETKKFYEQDECPTCSQKISDDTRHSMHQKTDSKIESENAKLKELNSTLDTLTDKLQGVSDKLQDVSSIQVSISEIDSALGAYNRDMKALIAPKRVTESDMKVKDTIKEQIDSLDLLLTEKTENVARLDVLNTIAEMFKDSGIKAMIVGEFIPLMNKKINEYLEKFDLFVNFNLDNEFNETIKSRHRDAFTYNSFSEGEKQRIDLAILFAWRAISMQKNAASTNLIIFDETLDQSLDADAVDVFMSILEDIGVDIRVFVVSHKDIVPDLFDRCIRVEKRNDFGFLEIT